LLESSPGRDRTCEPVWPQQGRKSKADAHGGFNISTAAWSWRTCAFAIAASAATFHGPRQIQRLGASSISKTHQSLPLPRETVWLLVLLQRRQLKSTKKNVKDTPKGLKLNCRESKPKTSKTKTPEAKRRRQRDEKKAAKHFSFQPRSATI
jgi:hypothetical protein